MLLTRTKIQQSVQDIEIRIFLRVQDLNGRIMSITFYFNKFLFSTIFLNFTNFYLIKLNLMYFLIFILPKFIFI